MAVALAGLVGAADVEVDWGFDRHSLKRGHHPRFRANSISTATKACWLPLRVAMVVTEVLVDIGMLPPDGWNNDSAPVPVTRPNEDDGLGFVVEGSNWDVDVGVGVGVGTGVDDDRAPRDPSRCRAPY